MIAMRRDNYVIFSVDLPAGIHPTEEQIDVAKTLAEGLLTLMCNGWNIVDVKSLSLPIKQAKNGDLSLKEVAETLGLKSTRPVRLLIHEGKLTHYRAPSTGKLGRIRITRESFEAYRKDLVRIRDLPLSHPDRGLSFAQILTEVIKRDGDVDLDTHPDIVAARRRMPTLQVTPLVHRRRK
jgi:hypothetical protein